MTAQSDFFHEATLILSSSLNLHKILVPFFALLREYGPVIRMGFGRGRLDLQAQEMVAVCTEHGVSVTPPDRLAPLSAAQVAMRSSLDNLWSEPEGLMVSEATHPVARYFACGEGEFTRARPPFFYMRLEFSESERPPVHERDHDGHGTPWRGGGRIVGAAVFECSAETPFTEKHLALLRSIRLPLRLAMDNCFQHRALRRLKEDIREENERLRQQLSGLSTVQVVGGREGLAPVMERARLAAVRDVPVLIMGETGTGKELIARAVHDLSPRKDKNFVAVNCGGIPSSLIDSELFGHVKGAFTGASYNHKGRFERAHGGTIFLDEIGELPLDVQARLLRVLQEMTIERVGGNAAVPVDFRLVAATHRDLSAMVREGLFREDLFYRLNVVPIQVPPLRERTGDIPLLVDHLVRRGAARFGILPPSVPPGEMARLLAHKWPGNVRELQNMVDEALVLHPQGPLRFRDIGRDRAPESGIAGSLATFVPYETMQREYFQQLLASTKGRINGESGAAALAGLNPSTFRFKLNKLGIPYGRGT